MTPVCTVSVAVPVPRLGLLTYLAPAGHDLQPGMRVTVPLGSRAVTGCIVAVETRALQEAEGLKPILRVLDATPLVPASSLSLALWAADYYLCGPGETLAATLPPMSRQRAEGFKRQRLATLTDAGRATDLAGLTDRQRAAIAALAAVPAGLTLPVLARAGASPAVMTRLADRGLVAIAHETIERDPFGATASGVTGEPSPFAHTLTDEQARALATLEGLAAAQAFPVALLHGVTGSGKTEVYLRLADAVRRAGRRRPDAGAGDCAHAGHGGAFARRRSAIRSPSSTAALSDGERHDQWQRIRRGEVDVVVGTRSAVFAPLAIAGPHHRRRGARHCRTSRTRARATTGATSRSCAAQRAGALVVLGSATPSMESYHHAMSGQLRLVTLERRVLDRPARRGDGRGHARGVRGRGAGRRAEPAAARRRSPSGSSAGEQSLVLLNRRGYATAVFCRQCAATLDCPNCSVR